MFLLCDLLKRWCYVTYVQHISLCGGCVRECSRAEFVLSLDPEWGFLCLYSKTSYTESLHGSLQTAKYMSVFVFLFFFFP